MTGLAEELLPPDTTCPSGSGVVPNTMNCASRAGSFGGTQKPEALAKMSPPLLGKMSPADQLGPDHDIPLPRRRR